MDHRVAQWLENSREELDEIYRRADAGTIPSGDTRGTAIVAGTGMASAFARFARLFALSLIHI